MKKKPDPARTELHLLIKSIIILLFMFILAFRASGLKDLYTSGTLWFQWGIFSLSFLLAHYFFRIIKFKGNPVLLPCTYVLSMFGFVILTRFGTSVIQGLHRYQECIYLVCVVLLVVTVLMFRQSRFNTVIRFYLPVSLGSFMVTGLLVLAGSTFRGARFGPAMTTPSEILKITYPLFLAGFFSGRKKDMTRAGWGIPRFPIRSTLLLLAGLGIPAGMAVLQNDFGMLLLLSWCLVIVVYAVTKNKRYLVFGLFSAIFLAWLVLQFSHHGQNRFQAFMDPWADPTGKAWQIVQSYFALNSGGILGTGLGKGSPETIPIVESDFIYAALAEELGLTGSACALLFFFIFIRQSLFIMRSQTNTFAYLFTCGLNSILITQILLNVGGVIGLIPITGMTLPFISRGGSSLLVSYCMAGIFLALSEPRGKRK